LNPRQGDRLEKQSFRQLRFRFDDSRQQTLRWEETGEEAELLPQSQIRLEALA
jgi:hypothetical protein